MTRHYRKSLTWWTAFLTVLALNSSLLWHFHDRYWYPSDDGFFANIAERLVGGEVMNRDIQDVHPGYVHFLHALAFKLFGHDIVSLRYPLIAAGLAQGVITFVLLAGESLALASLGSVAVVALGVIQFVDPSPNWYCLSICGLLVWWLRSRRVGDPLRLPVAGWLLGVLTLFRQLTGVWVAMGLLVVALRECPPAKHSENRWGARALLGTMLAALLWYLWVSPETEPGGLLLFAAWPLGILAWSLINATASNAATTGVIVSLAVGALAAGLPLGIYHAINGSIGIFFRDTVYASLALPQLTFFGHGWYGVLPLAAAYQALTIDPTRMLNGVYWMLIPAASLVNGAVTLRHLANGRPIGTLTLPVLSAFYGLVSLFLEGPLYLYYTFGLTLTALLWLAAGQSRPWRIAAKAAAATLAITGVVFHAGQPRTRTPKEILAGDRLINAWATDSGRRLERANLFLPDEDIETYQEVVAVIQQESAPTDTILALPNDAEWYFLARRRNPVRFYNSAFGILDTADLNNLVAMLEKDAPRLVIYRVDDKYNTQASLALMQMIEQRYSLVRTINGWQLYRQR